MSDPPPREGEPGDLSRIPQVDTLLRRDDAGAASERFGRRAVTDAIRRALDEVRSEIRAGAHLPRDDEVVSRAVRGLERSRGHRLRRVINATGVVLHTNLGRAPLSAAARDAVAEAAGYTSLEYDLAEGARGSRTRHLGELAAEVCGTEAATVVNNGAAALVIVLAALSRDHETIVSRGELIEIGGSYRLPEVMAASGAVMVEVGTTNRTRVSDYLGAIGERTGLLLKVHRSNYAIVGFTESAPADDLARLAAEHDLPFVYDLGSGLIHDHAGVLHDEPSVAGAIRDGADLVVFSGDKLLGGPQAGIIAGKRALVERIGGHPLARAVRVDNLQRAALEATLESHLRDERPLDLPTWAMIEADPDVLERRATAVAEAIGASARTAAVRSLVGGGALPGTELASWGVRLATGDPHALAGRLRALEPPVVARVEDDHVVLDLRTVAPTQDRQLADLVRSALERHRP